ncbi:DUF937 domain-containing protein [Sphingomonas sp.]|uniref:DUF937 domain-containing protein n=1 Tax=Sphingomonas sp. TaxID=28214 RepID=UPI002DD65AB4|nr:DUF937 domain-containing protein [Sphingomonas sp.]
MDIQQMLNSNGTVSAVARELGVDQSTAASGVQALLPAILGGFGKQGESGGLDALGGLIGGLGGGGLLDAVTGDQATPVGQGNEILGQIFGSKDTSRAVASHAADQTGISPDLLKKMLPIVAMAVAGYMAKQGGGSGGLGGLLGQVLGGGQQQSAPQSGGLGGILGQVLGGGAGGGSGNPLDAILGQLRR